MEKKKCGIEKRQRVVQNILKRAKSPMRPQDIKIRFNRWCDKHGYEQENELYMSRIAEQSNGRIVKEPGGKYSYNAGLDKEQVQQEELKNMLEHFTHLATTFECKHQVILRVDVGYEKIICNLLHDLFDKKDLFVFEGVGCILMMICNEEVLEDPALESIKETLEEYQNFMNQTEV